MKKFNIYFAAIVFAVAAVFAVSSNVSAQGRSRVDNARVQTRVAAPSSLRVEDFDYPAATLLTNSGWSAHSGAGTNAQTVTAPGLTFTGWPSAGNSVLLTTSGEDVNRAFAVQSAGSVYAGVLVNVTEAALNSTNGDYFFHLGPDPIGTSFRGRVYVQKDASNNVSFGISKAANNTAPANISYSPFSYSLNTTYLLVIKYTVVAGATNDTVSLVVLTSSFPGTEPAATVTAPDVTATDVNPGTVGIRQGTAASAPTVRVDSIRVGTSWADLTTAPPDANADFNGDGRTDFIVARATNTPFADGFGLGGDPEVKGRRSPSASAVPLAPQIYWYSNINGSGATAVQPWGDAATDYIVTEDFDGDGKDDLTVWREAAATQAAFYILNSATSTFTQQTFGQTGDDAAIVGDYDGDGKADPAVYRCPTIGTGDAQCFFFYRGSLSNPGGNITYMPWGFGEDGDFFPYTGDFDGDGKNDFCIQRSNPDLLTQGQFIMLKSGGGVEYINWGNSGDFLIPGDYDGDGKTDICVRRTEGTTRVHYLLTRLGATSRVVWGVSGDTSAPGDYDGDGKTDFAIWRGNADATQNNFWVLNSSNQATTVTEWGQCPSGNCDFAVAGWAVH